MKYSMIFSNELLKRRLMKERKKLTDSEELRE